MASLALSASGVNLNKAVSGKFDDFRGGFSFSFGSVTTNDSSFAKKRNTAIVSIATQPPPGVVGNPRTGKNDETKKLAAWTSVKQERWEGELTVEGELPLWLVRYTI